MSAKNRKPPVQMRRLRQWLLRERQKKRPMRPDNLRYKGYNKPECWVTYAEAAKLAEKYGRDISFAFSDMSKVRCVDVDRCIDADGNLLPKAEVVLELFPDTYVERSTSGTGLHVFFLADLPDGLDGKCDRYLHGDMQNRKIEIFATSQTIAMTFDRWERCPLRLADHSEGLVELLKRSDAPPTKRKRTATTVTLEEVDEETLGRLFERFPVAKQIFDGEINYPTPSEADLALANYARMGGLRKAQAAWLLQHRREEAKKDPCRDSQINVTLDKAYDLYVANADGMWWQPEGKEAVQLANFNAQIVRDIRYDDGLTQTRHFDIKATLNDHTHEFRVSSGEFLKKQWPMEHMGAEAIICAGYIPSQHLCPAIQHLSTPTSVHVFAHTGWRQIGKQWAYLHGGGAIGADNVHVDLPQKLAHYVLPKPPTGKQLQDAVRASLAMLDMGPLPVMASLLAAVYRAPLGECDFSLHLSGPTGSLKTATAAICQQHYGAAMCATQLPTSWASTANAIERIAHAAKDALLVVDDFRPTGSAADVSRYHQQADRLFRSQGNRAGRDRLTSTSEFQRTYTPRGLLLSTGEDRPQGESCRARLVLLELSPGDVNKAKLTQLQQWADAGLLAEAMAGFLAWLVPQYDDIRADLAERIAQDRDAINTHHLRTAANLASLRQGLRVFFEFAADVEAIDNAEARLNECWDAILSLIELQHEAGAEENEAVLFLRTLRSAIETEQCQLARAKDGTVMRGSGALIGWYDDEAVYLQPDASYAEAQRLLRQAGRSLGVSARTLWRHMKALHMLAFTDDNRCTTKRRIAGERRRVVAVRREYWDPDSQSAPVRVHPAPVVPRLKPTVLGH